MRSKSCGLYIQEMLQLILQRFSTTLEIPPGGVQLVALRLVSGAQGWRATAEQNAAHGTPG